MAIVEAAGGEWPQRIRTAALEVFASTAAEDASIGVQLLADIRTIFDDRADDKIYLRGHDRQAAGHREFAMGGLGPRRRLGQEQAGPLPAQVRCCPPGLSGWRHKLPRDACGSHSRRLGAAI